MTVYPTVYNHTMADCILLSVCAVTSGYSVGVVLTSFIVPIVKVILVQNGSFHIN